MRGKCNASLALRYHVRRALPCLLQYPWTSHKTILLQRDGVLASEGTYAVLINACAQSGEQALALKIYQRALDNGCTGNLLVYSAAMAACSLNRAGWLDAQQIFANMQRWVQRWNGARAGAHTAAQWAVCLCGRVRPTTALIGTCSQRGTCMP